MKEGYTMEYNKLKEILDLHKKWLNGDIDGKRAILWRENLQDADLQGAIRILKRAKGFDDSDKI